ncbi:hypothetical protein TanjilG_32873 [Lupinus angustifolius]|uniref:Uncharacterized protein n=1 Tax=Lupinus angustifolius TaxID=3871 RepID=A0A4P1RPE1_LUPAN|nr:PREDICTED: uncharacterized protein LOC109343281 [Lupinus angustifolius]OIW15469.1 hypothetical protein TanjilG_32873 [Lupinus angustifolius]
MGGGGAMRTAAKLAGIGAAATSGIKSVVRTPPTEQLVQNVSRPASTMLSSSSPQKAIASDMAPLHTSPSWDLEDWDVAEDGVLIMEAGEAMPRVVFGAVPSFQEAKDATTELKDAIDSIYLKSSSSSEYEGSSPGSQGSVVSPFNTELDTKFRAIDAISNPSVPRHAFQAFQLLSGSPEAQTAVASIACDPNVWNAVMQNPAVKDFFQSQQTVAYSEGERTNVKLEELPDSDPGNVFTDLMSILHNLKLSVAEMVSNMSSYLQNIFGFSMGEKSSSDADGGGNAKANLMDHLAAGGTFMGLAVLVVMIVVLKRV